MKNDNKEYEGLIEVIDKRQRVISCDEMIDKRQMIASYYKVSALFLLLYETPILNEVGQWI